MDSLVPALSSRLPILPRNALGREIQNGAQLNAAIALWNSLPLCPAVNLNAAPCHVGAMLAPVDPNIKFGRDFNSLDLRVTKRFTFAERHNLDFITEATNLFNNVNIRGFNNNNYSGFNNDITSTTFNRPILVAGGRPFGSGIPRAFQFALRYSF